MNILNIAVWYMFMTGRSGGVEVKGEGRIMRGEGGLGEGGEREGDRCSQIERFVPHRISTQQCNMGPEFRISNTQHGKQITIP